MLKFPLIGSNTMLHNEFWCPFIINSLVLKYKKEISANVSQHLNRQVANIPFADTAS